jgi:hypothetical protein
VLDISDLDPLGESDRTRIKNDEPFHPEALDVVDFVLLPSKIATKVRVGEARPSWGLSASPLEAEDEIDFVFFPI